MAGGEVKLVDLVKRFGDFMAVAGLNLDMPQGEFFSLLGPSGCGKTTTLRMIAGFEKPSEGQILLDGVDMAQTPPHKRNVNTVFQSYALFPHLSVEENVAFGLRYKDATKSETKERVGKALELVALTGFEKRFCHLDRLIDRQNCFLVPLIRLGTVYSYACCEHSAKRGDNHPEVD